MTWWNEKAWPWIKENWWKVFLPLILLFGAISAFFVKRTTVIDPTVDADARAKEEQARREAGLTEERQERENELREVRQDAVEARQEFEAGQAGEVERLRESPEELKERMLRARRGR